MGTELERNGLNFQNFIWSAQALIQSPEKVEAVHKSYLDVNVDILTTNTFRTTPYAFHKVGLSTLDAYKYMKVAVELTKMVIRQNNQKCYIFGSVAPLEDCFRSDLVPNDTILLKEHAKTLVKLDSFKEIDYILFETQNSLREIKILCQLSEELLHASGLSVTLNNQGSLLDGSNWESVLRVIGDSKFEFLGINCVAPPIITKALKSIQKLGGIQFPLLAYANIGYPDPITNELSNFQISPQNYLKEALEWQTLGVKIIGGCCGTTPDYIQTISNFFKYKK